MYVLLFGIGIGTLIIILLYWTFNVFDLDLKRSIRCQKYTVLLDNY